MTLYRHYSEIPEGVWRWKHFPPQEIACRGTGAILLDAASMDALDRLEKLRVRIGKPFYINSGFRSPEWNKKIGGEKNSYHMKGVAFDISMKNHNPTRFITQARMEGFNGIGQYPHQDFVHIDTGPRRNWNKGGEFKVDAKEFSPEEPKKPFSKRRTVIGTAVTGTATVATAIKDAKEPISAAVDATGSATLGYVLTALTLLGVAIVAYAAWDRYRKGKD